MSNDISAFGLRVTIFASITFPNGIDITQFADDADPLDQPSQQLRDKAMGLNGDMVTWAKANSIPATISVIPGSEDDLNLQVLAEANRTGKGKRAVQDVITMVVSYGGDQDQVTLTDGVITDAIIGNAVASAGRLKSKPYVFAFENRS